MSIQTTFAHGINPFTGLGAMPTTQPKPTMQTPAKPAKTKRADEDYSTPYTPPVATPAPVLTATPVNTPTDRAGKKPAAYVTLDELSITNDALPASRTLPIHKYHAVLAGMKMGQCVRCPTASVGKVAGAMRKFIATQQMHAQIKSVTRFEGDQGFGRVWMLPAPAQALKSVA